MEFFYFFPEKFNFFWICGDGVQIFKKNFCECRDGVQHPAPHPSKGLRGIGTPASSVMAKRTTSRAGNLPQGEWTSALAWLRSQSEPTDWCFNTRSGEGANGPWCVISLSTDKAMTTKDFFLQGEETIGTKELITAILDDKVLLKPNSNPFRAGWAKIASAKSGYTFLDSKELKRARG